ncbi:MAG: 30S ribosomal protein S6 [Pseudomonadales bacterium]|nr:30S ribosomal protein S6 [Pseudomonadales bacterium]
MMEILASPRVRQYELTYLVPGSLSSSEVSKTNEAVEKLLKKHKIKVISQEDWGKKKLAYPIKYKSVKNYEAFYTHMVLESDSLKIGNFEKGIYLLQDIIRHLIVLAEKETSSVEDLRTE